MAKVGGDVKVIEQQDDIQVIITKYSYESSVIFI